MTDHDHDHDQTPKYNDGGFPLKLTKKEGWRGRLSATIGRHRREAFSWGVHDCGILAADAVLAMTEVDLAEGFRGTYKDAQSAMKRLRVMGYRSHIEIAERHFREIPPSEASVGDIVAIPIPEASELEGDGDLALGVVAGEVVAVYTPAGVGMVPVVRAVRAFRVENH